MIVLSEFFRSWLHRAGMSTSPDDSKRKADSSQARRKDGRCRRQYRPALESLEDRTLLDFNVGAQGFQSSGADLYLNVGGGVLQYHDENSSSFVSTGQTISSNVTITNVATGTLYLTGMDQGGGIYTTPGPVVISGNLSTRGNDLSITGSSIQVGNPTLDSIVVSTAPAVTAAAGKIVLTAPLIAVGNTSHLLAQGTNGPDGAITMTATDTHVGALYLSLADQGADLPPPDFQAGITIGANAVIRGGAVSLTATAGDTTLFPDASQAGQEALSNLSGPFSNYVNQYLSFPISVLIAKATATTEVGPGATIASSGAVTISSSATVNATGEASWWYNTKFGLAFAYALATSTAETLIDTGANISAQKNVLIQAQTTTTTSSTAQVMQNPNIPLESVKPSYLDVAGAYNELTTTAHAIVAQGATITTPASVLIIATGQDNNSINVQTNTYMNGYVGLSGGGADVHADVKALVDGKIIAGRSATGSEQTVNPFLATTVSGVAPAIDYDRSRFIFTTDPGYSTGDPVVYSSGLGGAIRGLTKDTTYFAVVSNNAVGAVPATQFYMQLAATLDAAAIGAVIPFGQYPTLAGLPVTHVDSGNDVILYDFDPGFTEGQAVTFSPRPGQFLGMDTSAGSWLSPLSSSPGAYTIHISNSTVDAANLYAIQLKDANGDLVALDDSPYLTTSTGQLLRIQNVQSTANQLVLNPADLANGIVVNNGDALVYHAALGAVVSGLTDGTTYYAIVDPSQFAAVDPANPPTLLLAGSLNAAQASNPVQQNPTLTWNNGGQTTTVAIPYVQEALPNELLGNGQAFYITASSASNVLTLSLKQNSQTPPLAPGMLLTYHGADGSSNTLRDGHTYAVYTILNNVSATNTDNIQVTLRDTLALPTLGVLTETAGAGQSFTLQFYDAGTHVVTMRLNGANAYTPLTEGQTLTYTGAALPGFLQNGQTYFVHILQQASPAIVEVQLTPAYFVTASGALAGAAGNRFVILHSDPNTNLLTLSGLAGIVPTSGELFTYTSDSPSVPLAGYLQSGQNYTVVIPDASNPLQVQLVSARYQIGTSGVLSGSGQAASSANARSTDGHSFTILGADFATGILMLAEQSLSEFTALVEGEWLYYQGPSGNQPNSLQNGQWYTVHIVDQSKLQAIQVQLKTTSQRAGYGTLTGRGGSYVIHESDGDGTLWIAQVGTAAALTDGAVVTFSGGPFAGALAPRLSYLQNQQQYSVIVVNQEDPSSSRIKLAQYQGPTYGKLSGAGHAFTVQDFTASTNSVVLSADSGATIPALAEGETLVYAGSVITSPGLLQNGQSYTVHIIDQSNPQAIRVQLQNAGAASLADLPDHSPAAVARNGRTYLIDPHSNAIYLSSAQTPIPNGTVVTYHAGGPGTQIGGLQDGASYQAVVDPSAPTIIHLAPASAPTGPQVQLTLDQTLRTASGAAYTIVGSNALAAIVTIVPVPVSGVTPPNLAEGEAVTYAGALGFRTGSLVDGATYYVHIPDPSTPDAIQLQMSPGSGTLDLKPNVALGAVDVSYLSGTAHTLTPVLVSGIGIVAKLTSQESLAVSSGQGSQPLFWNKIPFGQAFFTQFLSGSFFENKVQSLPDQTAHTLALTASFMVAKINNSVAAEVGVNAVLASTGNVVVNGAITEDNQAGVNSSSYLAQEKQPDVAAAAPPANASGTQVAVALGLLFDSLNNSAHAFIDSGSHVDASGDLTVSAQVTYPWVGQINNPNGFNPKTYNYVGTLFAFLDGALGFDSLLVNNWADAVAVANENAGDIALAGAVNWTEYTNDCQARIDAGALINQNPTYRSAAQSVAVAANTTFESVNLSGNTDFDFLPDDLRYNYNELTRDKKSWKGIGDEVIAPNRGKRAGVGASLTAVVLSNNTQAIIGGTDTGDPATAARINFGQGKSQYGLSVTATQFVFNLNIGTSGGLDTSGLGVGGEFGGNGTFSFFDANTNTVAHVASGAIVNSNPGTAGAVNVAASDTLLHIAIAGSGFRGDHGGIGASGILNRVTRDTDAVIGNLDGEPRSPSASSWNVGGPVFVTAAADGHIISVAVAGAVAAPSSEDIEEGNAQAENPNQDPPTSASWGLQISGDGSYTRITDNTQAYIDDPGTFATGALTVRATDTTLIVGIGGAYAVSLLTEGKNPGETRSLGIAGSYSQIDLDGTTTAFIQDAALNVTGALSVTAERDNYVGALTLSLAGDSLKSSWEIAGAVALLFFSGQTEAYLTGVTGTVSGVVTVTATDSTICVALGGGLAVGGNLGLGVSIGYIAIQHQLEAYIDDTSLASEGNVNVEARASTALTALGMSLGLARGKKAFAGAANVSVNVVEMTLDAHIGAASQITSSGSVTVEADDDTFLGSVSGGFAVADAGTAAAGAAVSYNMVANSIQASIDHSTVEANDGDLRLVASSSPQLVGLVAGGADADKVAFGGSAGVNSVVNRVVAGITNDATVSTSSDLVVTAAEEALEVVVAGAIGIAGTVAVGAAIAYDYMGHSFDTANPQQKAQGTGTGSSAAYIDASNASANGNVTVSSGFGSANPPPPPTAVIIDDTTGFGSTLPIPVSVTRQLMSIALGGAFANTFALGAALTLSSVRQNVTAYIADGAAVSAHGDVTIESLDHSSIGNGVLGLDVSKKGAAVGADVAYNDIANSLSAFVSGSTLSSATGTVSVLSQEQATITAVALGVSGAKEFALGGSVVINGIDNTMLAAIQSGSSVTANGPSGGIVVSSGDESKVEAGAGAVSIAPNLAAVGASVVVSDIRANTQALIASAATTAGTVLVAANSNSSIIAVAVGGDGAADFALGGSVVYNSVSDTTQASIQPGAQITADGVFVTADDRSSIRTGAGQVSIATSGSAVGAAVAVNTIGTTVAADITGATVTSSGAVTVAANSRATILGVALGVGGGVANDKLGFGIGLIGSATVNNITNTTQAQIAGNSRVTTSNGSPVSVTATDTASIEAIAGAASLELALNGGGVSAAVGASVAINALGGAATPDSVQAAIDNATVQSDGGVTVSAGASAGMIARQIDSYSFAGAGSFSRGVNTDVGIAGAGAYSSNMIVDGFHALIQQATVTSKHGGDVQLAAVNSSSILAVAGGVSVARAVNGKGGVAVSVGAAFAVNDITTTTDARIIAATLTSAGAVTLDATNSATIKAVAIGVAGALVGGSNQSLGVSVSGAGSMTGSHVTDVTEATIASGSQVNSGGDVQLTAQEKPSIIAAAGTLAFSFAISGSGSAVAPAVGVSIGINSIKATVTANIDRSSVSAGGNVVLTAQTQPPSGAWSIKSVTIAGGAEIGGADTGALAVAGAGAISENSVNNQVSATITGCSGTDSQGRSLAVKAAGNATLSAKDNSTILADGGGVTVALALGTAALAPAIGAGWAQNSISNQTTASIDASVVTATGTQTGNTQNTGHVSLSAVSTVDIEAKAFGVAISGAAEDTGAAAAGSGSVALNTVQNTILAAVEHGSTVSASAADAKAVSVTASDSSTVKAGTGAGSLGFATGNTAVALAAGVSISQNEITNSIEAFIGASAGGTDATTVTAASGGVYVAATSHADIEAVSVAVAATVAIPTNPDTPISVALSGAGASATNTITNTITAAIQNDSTVHADGTSANSTLAVSAGDTATIKATVGAGSFDLAVFGLSIGASVINNTVTNQVRAFIASATATTQGDVNITAQAAHAIGGKAVATSASVALVGGAGAGASSSSTDNSIIAAFVGSGSTIRTNGRVSQPSASYGALNILASVANSTATAESDGGDAGFDSIGVFLAAANVGGSTTAYLDAGCTIAVGNLAVNASTQHTVTARAIGVGVAPIFGAAIGGTSATTTVTEVVEAYLGVPASSAAVAPARTYALTGTLTITASANNTAHAEADSGLAGFGAVSGNVAHSTVAPTVKAYVSDNLTIHTTGDMTVSATATNTATSNITGIVVAGIGVGVSDGQTTNAAIVAAYVGNVTLHVAGALTIAAVSNDTATTNAQASGGAVLAGGNGAVADATITPNVTAYAGDPAPGATTGANIAVTGAVNISAKENATANATGYGVEVSLGLTIGVVLSHATITAAGKTASYLSDHSSLSAGSLVIQAAQAATATAATTAGAGGLLIGTDGARSSASAGGSVSAYTGTHAQLPKGDIAILAGNQTTQTATTTGGGAGGTLSVGVDIANAESHVATLALLGASAIMDSSRQGSLTVKAMGLDTNSASTTAGSGGYLAGAAAIAGTSDGSTVRAALAGGSGTIYAGRVTVSALNASDFATSADSTQAAVFGGSGAVATTDDTTSATATLGDSTTIHAKDTITFAAQNLFRETTTGPSARAGAGGTIDGTAATSAITLDGLAYLAPAGVSVTPAAGAQPLADVSAGVLIGKMVQLRSGTDPLLNPGGIILAAATLVDASDSAALLTPGLIEGAGASSTLNATLANVVAIGSNADFVSHGDIGIGTYSTISAQTLGEVNDWGVLVSVGIASADSSVTSSQAVSVGPDATFKADHDVRLTPGIDPLGRIDTTIDAQANTLAYTRSVIGVAPDTSTATVASNAALTISPHVIIQCGQDVTIGAFPGSATATETGTSRGTAIFGAITDSYSRDGTITTNSSLTQDGSITAGTYHKLSITIPDDKSAGNSFSKTIATNSDGSSYVPFTSSFNSAFNPRDFVRSQFTNAIEQSVLESGVANSAVGAITLGPLFASGGSVALYANDKLTGSGTITAYGAPTISITNLSPDYLVLGAISIPDVVSGLISFTGQKQESDARHAGITIHPVNPAGAPLITINQAYNGAVGQSSYGPGLFLMGDIDNLQGPVNITNVSGSIGQTGAIQAAQVSISSPNGNFVFDQPSATVEVGTSPYSIWQDSMIWPGGNPTDPNANTNSLNNIYAAIAYAANAIENADGSIKTFVKFLGHLYKRAGNAPPDNTSTVYLGNSVPYYSGPNPLKYGDDTQGTNEQITADAFAGVGQSVRETYRLGSGGTHYLQGYFPWIPFITKLSKSSATAPATSPGNGLTALTIYVTAQTIDINGPIKAGGTNGNWSVNLPASLSATLSAYQESYKNGTTPNPLFALSGLTTTSAGDALIVATYDAETNQILIDDVSTSGSGGYVSLSGKIISSTANQSITLIGGPGQVTVQNETGITVVVHNLDSARGSAVGQVDITDTNFSSSSNQTLYVYQPDGKIAVYEGAAGAILGGGTPSRIIAGNSTSYQPQAGIRWQWQQAASLSRGTAVAPGNGLFPSGNPDWGWDYTDPGNNNNHWQFVDPVTGNLTSTPVGRTIIKANGAPFEESISATTNASVQFEAQYSNNDFDFNSDFPWYYNYPTNLQLTLTSSVKADYPITLNFGGSKTGSVTIESNAPVLVTGKIVTNGTVTINALGDISETASASVIAQNLSLNSSSQTVGDPAAAQPNLDTGVGQVHINNQTFSGRNQPASFSFYAPAAGHYVTPLIFSVAEGGYTLAAVYQSIQAGQGLNENVPLTLLQGGLAANGTFVFGYADQQVALQGSTLATVSSTSGTIPFGFAPLRGFGGDGSGWTVNSNGISSTPISDDVLTLTDNGNNQARSAYYNTPVPFGSFTASFIYQAGGDKAANGVAFVLQNPVHGNVHYLGENGAGLGYQSDSFPISAAYEINLFNGNGNLPGTTLNYFGHVGNYNDTSPVNVASGNPIQVVLTYDKATETLNEQLTDLATNQSYHHSHSANSLRILFQETVFIGFTGGDGGDSATQTIRAFTFASDSAALSAGDWLYTTTAGNSSVPLVLGATFSTGQGAAQSLSTGRIYAANLSFAGGGGIGRASRPFTATLGTDGVLTALSPNDQGIYLSLNSGALINQISAGNTQTGSGDVVLHATRDLLPQPGRAAGAVNVTGRNITLTSTGGVVGTQVNPLVLQTNTTPASNGGIQDGTVNAIAHGDVGLVQSAGDLLVGSVTSTTGNAYLNARGGSILDANSWVASGPSLAQAQQAWQDLHLTDPAHAHDAVVHFQHLVERNYRLYWQLLNNGIVAGGSFLLNAAAVPLYRAQASAALGVAAPTSSEVRDYANRLFQQHVAFFDHHIGTQWLNRPEFQAFDPHFQYSATPQQTAELVQPTLTTGQLLTTVSASGIRSAAVSSPDTQAANVTGKIVTLVAAGSIGKGTSATEIPVMDIQNGTVSPDQQKLLAQATAAGDVRGRGINTQGQVVTFALDQPAPAGVTLQAVELSTARQLFVTITGSDGGLSARAASDINIASASGNLPVMEVKSTGGTVDLAAPGSIVSNAANISGFGGNGTGWTVNSQNIGLPAIGNDELTLRK